MQAADIRQKFLSFFQSQGHRIIASASLVPENDPSTLFTGSGMQPLIPYLLGEPHPEGVRLANSQKSFRAEDIEEVGDNRHTTFFEMLGNWSLGDYFKREQLPWFFEFLVSELHLDPKRLYVTVFAGDKENGIPRDTESVAVWKDLFANQDIQAVDVEVGTVEAGARLGMRGGRIFYYDASKNWWSRAGPPEKMPEGEPGGPDSEVFFEFTDVPHDVSFGVYCHPNCDCGRFLEIGNSVFMEYRRGAAGFERLKQRNVDFGGGLERLTAAANGYPDIFRIDTLAAMIDVASARAGKCYETVGEGERRSLRVIADHLRAAVFLVADGAEPSNKERGYVVRRLLRRAVRHMDLLGMQVGTLYELVATVAEKYMTAYPDLGVKKAHLAESVRAEEEKFRRTLSRGLREFERLAAPGFVTGSQASTLFSTYGFPIEFTNELAREQGIKIVEPEEFTKDQQKHKEVSRAGVEQKFHGGLADHSWETTRGHTATHLLHATLRKVLGEHVYQRGSNITAQRLRFDFSHPEKLTAEQIKRVEDMVNEVVQRGLPVTWCEMTYEEARAAGALGLFESKYGDKVKVYTIGDYSSEVCGGPHVGYTAEVGEFKIVKEEAVSAGVRRIKAVVS